MHYELLHMQYQVENGQLTAKRGRPIGATEGARKAVKTIEAVRKQHRLSEQDLADRVCIAQSSVNRALKRDPPVWTPSLKKLFAYAKNNSATSKVTDADAAALALSHAALAAWDGTEAGLRRLVRILQLLAQHQATQQRSDT